MIPVNWYWCRLLSPCRLHPESLQALPPPLPLTPFLRSVTLISDTFPPTAPLLLHLAVLSDEDLSVLLGGAAGVSLHPRTQWLPGGVCGLRSACAAAAAAAATSIQHHGECLRLVKRTPAEFFLFVRVSDFSLYKSVSDVQFVAEKG